MSKIIFDFSALSQVPIFIISMAPTCVQNIYTYISKIIVDFSAHYSNPDIYKYSADLCAYIYIYTYIYMYQKSLLTFQFVTSYIYKKYSADLCGDF